MLAEKKRKRPHEWLKGVLAAGVGTIGSDRDRIGFRSDPDLIFSKGDRSDPIFSKGDRSDPDPIFSKVDRFDPDPIHFFQKWTDPIQFLYEPIRSKASDPIQMCRIQMCRPLLRSVKIGSLNPHLLDKSIGHKGILACI